MPHYSVPSVANLGDSLVAGSPTDRKRHRSADCSALQAVIAREIADENGVQKQTTFSHPIAWDSPFRTHAESHRFALTARLVGSIENSLIGLSPVTYADINPLQRKKLHRVFECLSLRQTFNF